MAGRVEGKVAIVTGAAGLLGGAGARLLAQEGAKVVFNDISPRVEEVVAEAKAEGLDVVAHVGSNVVEADVEAMVKLAVDSFGRLDILWNNGAPVSNDFIFRDTHVTDMTLDYFLEVLHGHAGSVFLCSKHAIPAMIESGGGGSIINASSEQSYGGDLVLQAYGTAKAAINALTQNIATYYGQYGIRCNAVGPGLVPGPSAEVIAPEAQKMILDAQMLPRPGVPSDIANAMLFLASDESSWVTSQIVFVDGGLSGHQTTLSTRRTLAGGGHQDTGKT